MAEIYTFDVEKPEDIYAYFQSMNFIDEGQKLSVESLCGGVSNKTVLVEFGKNSFVVKQGLEKLRVEEDWYSDPERVQAEGHGMLALNQLLPVGSVPEFHYLDKEQNILIMEAIKKPHENFKERLLKGNDESELIEKMAILLATIHKNAWGSKKLQQEFSNKQYFNELRTDPFFYFVAEKYPELKSWYESNIYPFLEVKNTLVHGDFSPKNILVKRKKLILLDHEVIHFGDFAFDFGFAMAHLFLKGLHINKSKAKGYSDLFAKVYFKYMQNYIGEEDINRAWRIFMACLIARVAGKSRMNYLSDRQENFIKEKLFTLILSEKEFINNNLITFLKEEIYA